MTAFALPSFRRRKSKPQQAAEAAVKIWAAMKAGSAAAKTAQKGAKAYGKFKAVKIVGKRGAKLLVIPIAAGGGFAAYKKLSSSSSDEPATPYGSPVGPAATPSTVTPPKTAPGSAAGLNGEGGITDPPAGAVNPPSPPGSTS